MSHWDQFEKAFTKQVDFKNYNPIKKSENLIELTQKENKIQNNGHSIKSNIKKLKQNIKLT